MDDRIALVAQTLEVNVVRLSDQVADVPALRCHVAEVGSFLGNLLWRSERNGRRRDAHGDQGKRINSSRRKRMIVWVFEPQLAIRAHCSLIGATGLHNAFLLTGFLLCFRILVSLFQGVNGC